MIKRIKYGCFALLFISTLTLSSIVAILASSSAGLDNSFLLTYEPPAEVQLLSGQELNKVIKNATDYSTSNYTITSITFGDCSDENLAKVENATRCVSVASDGSDNALLYEVGAEIYILSSGKMLAQDCSYMFYNCTGLTSLDLTSLDTANVTNMSRMFYCCGKLTSLDLTCLDTTNVTDMSYMFNECTSLTNLDLSSFNTSNVTNLSHMFDYCNTITSLDITSFDTTNVLNMSYMFSGCSRITSLDLTGLDTSNVTNMEWMFSYCNDLTRLDLTSFDTANVTSMSDMFSYCGSLTTIYADESWSTENVSGLQELFLVCSDLVGGNGTTCNGFDNIDITYARIDTAKTPGYFTLKTA